jgi:GTP-binding protein
MSKEYLTSNPDCRFVGSFFKLEQMPKDRKPQIAFAGRSNVGKSSLLNKLVSRKKLAKVSQTPGKTRAINFFDINDAFYMVDLPGYGYAKVSKSEQAGWGKMIEDYLMQCEQLSGLVLLIDCRRETTPEDLELIDWLAQRGLPTMIVITKTDKLTRDKTNQRVAAIEKDLGASAMPFSTVTGVGKKELAASINELLNQEN